METFKERLRWLRRMHGFTQIELAEAAGMCRYQITGYETGSYLPGYAVLCRLATTFSCSLDFLMTGWESPFLPMDEKVAVVPEAVRPQPDPEPEPSDDTEPTDDIDQSSPEAA